MDSMEQMDSDILALLARERGIQRAIDDLHVLKTQIINEREEKEAKKRDLEMQSINWLPPELLTQIFAAVVDLDFEEGESPHPPFVLSHVCARWRELALSTPYLWSRICLRGFRKPQVLDALLSRSRDLFLDLSYAVSMATDESFQVAYFLRRVSSNFYRCKEFSFQSKSAAAVASLLPFFQEFPIFFPSLQRLSLSISTPNPSFFDTPELLQQIESLPLPSKPSCLRHLILNQVPSCSLPTDFICNLRKLELSYSTAKQYPFRHHYHLKLSSLCALLALTPQLEELVLFNTVPHLDALPTPTQIPSGNAPSSFVYLSPVRLEHLRSIEWTYPSTADVPRLLCLLDAPVLDKLDLWVEKPPPRRPSPVYRPSAVSEYVHFTPSFPILRDLCLQCNGDESMLSVLRRFSLPVIERAAFTNVDPAARIQDEGKEPKLIDFPRLESIFLDPRLPHLTHLTLSHFKIPAEAGRGESLLGYMPLLISLSLDSCLGVGRLLEGLQEKLIIGIMSNTADPNRIEPPSKRGVKLCPRLEALSIWGCQDVDFDSLRAVVLARNGTTKATRTRADGADTETTGLSHGAIFTGNVIGRDVREGNQGGGNPDCCVLTQRKIKPLKSKLPILRAATMSSTSSEDPKAKIVSTLVAMREVLEPANIIYVRVAQCKLVTKEHADSLRDLGVIDVIWASSD